MGFLDVFKCKYKGCSPVTTQMPGVVTEVPVFDADGPIDESRMLNADRENFAYIKKTCGVGPGDSVVSALSKISDTLKRLRGEEPR